MLCPYAPAFIDSAPPTVPGIPESGSIPDSPDRAQSTASRGSIAPASTTTDPPERNTTLERCFFVHRTVADTPASATRRLDPAPRTFTGRPERPSATMTSRTWADDLGNTSRSAAPPIPMVVYSRSFTWSATSISRTTVRASLPLPPLPREKAFSQFPDIAGPHRQKDVPRLQDDANRLSRSDGFTQIPGLPMSVLPDRDAERFAGGALDRLLPRGVPVEDEPHVRVLERREELLEQRTGARVPVRLESDDDPPAGPDLPRRGQGRPDLRRVVAVIVHHRDAADLPLYLEAPPDPGVRGQAGAHLVERDSEFQGDRRRGQGVADVVAAGRPEEDLAEPLAPCEDGEPVRHPGRDHILRTVIRGTGEPVGDVGLLHGGDQLLDIRVVDAQDREPVEGDLVDEVEERLLDLPDPRIEIEVLRVDVGDHRHRRGKLQERAVALVRLRDKELSLAQLRVGPEAVQLASHDRGRVPAGRREHRGDHRGRRGLPVRPGDRDAVLHPHQLRQHLGARDHGDLPAVRLEDLGVVRPDRRGDDDHVAVRGDVRGGMPRPHHRPEPLEPLRRVGAAQVGPRYPVPEVQEQFRDPAHPDADDPHEVDGHPLSIHPARPPPRRRPPTAAAPRGPPPGPHPAGRRRAPPLPRAPARPGRRRRPTTSTRAPPPSPRLRGATFPRRRRRTPPRSRPDGRPPRTGTARARRGARRGPPPRWRGLPRASARHDSAGTNPRSGR